MENFYDFYELNAGISSMTDELYATENITKNGGWTLQTNEFSSCDETTHGSLKYRCAMSMSKSDVLRQYRIGKTIENSLWYRCPRKWTVDMMLYYTKIEKSKRYFDCEKVMKKIRKKHGSSPADWQSDPVDQTGPMPIVSTGTPPRCTDYGELGWCIGRYCNQQPKSEVCIMCGFEGHTVDDCNRKMCLSCGTRQNQFTHMCAVCESMSTMICSVCGKIGHGSKYCSETWRRFHNITSTRREQPRFDKRFVQYNYDRRHFGTSWSSLNR